MVVDEDNNWNPVCYPYKKFYNYNEGKSHKLDWSNPKLVKVYEKVDGSIVTLYHYKGKNFFIKKLKVKKKSKIKKKLKLKKN